MRALVACFALFLAVTTLDCKQLGLWGPLLVKNVNWTLPPEANCTGEGYHLNHNEKKNLTFPFCGVVECSYGMETIHKTCKEDKENKTEGQFYPECCEELW